MQKPIMGLRIKCSKTYPHCSFLYMADTLTKDVKIPVIHFVRYLFWRVQVYLVHVQSVYLLVVLLSHNNASFVCSNSRNCKSNGNKSESDSKLVGGDFA